MAKHIGNATTDSLTFVNTRGVNGGKLKRHIAVKGSRVTVCGYGMHGHQSKRYEGEALDVLVCRTCLALGQAHVYSYPAASLTR